MYQPALYSSNNSCVVKSIGLAFTKYRHLLNFKENENILEIGTGDGKTTAMVVLPNLPKSFKEFVLSDKSPVMLDHAKKMEVLSKMQFMELDVESQEVPQRLKNRFDHIISATTFHFIKNTRQALHNIYNMLKPGGETFCIFFSEMPPDEAFYGLSKHPRWSKYDPDTFVSPYFRNPKIFDIYHKDLKDCGFEKFCLEPIDYQYDFSSENEMKNILTAVNLSVNKIPKEHLNEYLEDYFHLVRNSKFWSTKKSENGEELPSMLMKLVTLYAKKI